MPANLPPDYHRAEERFRTAKTAQEKIEALEEMLRIMPKHKGTDHLQADIKARIAKLRRQPAKKGARAAHSYVIPREGAGQIALVGPANTGKSSLVRLLTHATPEVADYPFTTREPTPGMMPFEDIAFQLVDLPPLSMEHIEPWVFDLVRHADLLWVVLGGANPHEEFEETRTILAARNIQLRPAERAAAGEGLPAEGGAGPGIPSRSRPESRPDPLFASSTAGTGHAIRISGTRLPALQAGREAQPSAFGPVKTGLLVVTGLDRREVREELDALDELLDRRWPFVAVSCKNGVGLEDLKRRTFEAARIIRVYSKQPGKPPDRSAPFTLGRGSTVGDLAERIHKDLLAHLRFARVWGPSAFDGQTVQRDHVLAEGDVIEIHA